MQKTWQGIKLTDTTKQLVQKYCEETGENPEDFLQKAFDQFFKIEKTKTSLPKVKIEYETVTLNIPKKLMDWLRSMEKAEGKTAEQQLEYELVDKIRSDIEALTGEELISLFELAPIFYELLDDKRFKS